MNNTIKIFIAVIALFLGLIGYQFLVPREVSFGLFSSDDGAATLRYGVTFAATIVGVVLGSIYRGLKLLKETNQSQIPPGFFVGRFRSVDMWIGLVASPIIFALLLKASDGMTLAGLVVMALENGFCALIIIDSLNPTQQGLITPASTTQ